MTQITLQSASPTGTPSGASINLEVASFDESRKAKLKTYSRVQAFSDVSLIVGAYNAEFSMAIAVPQDFAGGEDIETLLAGMQSQDQILTDVEGVAHLVRITQIGTKHEGGQPFYYVVDVTMIETYNFNLPT
jgi:hypothetical protein